MKIELQQLKIDIMKFCLKFLTKQNALRIEHKSPFRKPTHKEERKHHRLVEKQRRRLG